MAMETNLEAMNRLTKKGYNDQFRAEKTGLRALHLNRLYDPKELIVDEVVRFEGVSNPDQMSILFALRCSKGEVKGTYCSSYGPKISLEDSEIVANLEANSRGTQVGEKNPSTPIDERAYAPD